VHEIDRSLSAIKTKYTNLFVVLRNARLTGTFSVLRDSADAAQECVVHQRMKLAGKLLALGVALMVRKLKILCGLFVFAALCGLLEAKHRSVRGASTEGVAGFLGSCLSVSNILALSGLWLSVGYGLALSPGLKLD
jgi:hypothetical protein